VKLFLDTSVLLAAAASAIGASREIFRLHQPNHWMLLSTPYVVQEVLHNLPKLPPAATVDWNDLRKSLVIREDVLTLDRITVFEPAKDRPILFSAYAFADILLTLDQQDFGALMDQPFYGLMIQRPGTFLAQQRAAGLLQ
jgi:predicted nucleic acid-binding protein